MLTVDKQGGTLAVGGGEIGSGDIIDGFRFDRLERGAWKISDSTGACTNWIVMSEHTAQYDFKRDPEKGLRVLRHTELDVFKPERGTTWTPWRKPINVKVSPEIVLEANPVRLVTDDDKVKLPYEANGLVRVQVKGGTFAAVIKSSSRGRVLRELYVRRGADTRPIKRLIDIALRNNITPGTAPLNNTLSQLDLKV
jgi:hypothetical protein